MWSALGIAVAVPSRVIGRHDDCRSWDRILSGGHHADGELSRDTGVLEVSILELAVEASSSSLSLSSSIGRWSAPVSSCVARVGARQRCHLGHGRSFFVYKREIVWSRD